MAIETGDNGDELNPTVGVAEEEEEENEDETAAEEEEEEDGEEAEEYTFRFKNGMSPSEFVDNNDSSVHRYQQYQRLENQALADKMRKSLPQSHPEGTSSKKAREDNDNDDISGAMAEMMELMNLGVSMRSRKLKKRGRRKGSKNKQNPKVTRMLGDATIHYSSGRYDQAIAVLHAVVRLAPNLHESYHTLGLVYYALKDYKRAMHFYMIAAHLNPKNSLLWDTLFKLSIEQGDVGQAGYCLSKAITADPKNITFRKHRAWLYVELGDYQKAAVAYEQVHHLCRENVDALKAAAKFYQKCGQVEYSVRILEDYLKSQPDKVNTSVVDQLAAILMETKVHDRALQHIEHVQVVNLGKEFFFEFEN